MLQLGRSSADRTVVCCELNYF